MVITVTDGGSPSVKTDTTTVIMTVLPVNDNDPAAGTATCSTVKILLVERKDRLFAIPIAL